ncbi:nucleoporin NUP42-like [Meleagris gallopavo]|uniref:nucleoporin NUP42-like n=1 Tax=Meleagris gallopavo TaxID=9103 RepID=UPI00093E3D67|nr:nucleoporin NUP42-like [Meleagris gallopavo]
MIQHTEGAVGGLGDATQIDTNLSQPAAIQHTEGAVGGSGDATQIDTNLSQPPVIQHMEGAVGGLGDATQIDTNLSQPPVIQHMEGAVGGLGDATQIDTNLSQPPVIQHTRGEGGGRVPRARRAINLLRPDLFLCKGGAAGGRGAPTAVVQPPVCAKSKSSGSRDGGGLSGASGSGPAGKKSAVSSQKAPSALSSAAPGDGQRDGQQRLLDCAAKDMATSESSGQWVFSCYSPVAGKPSASGFREISPEEGRLEYYNCRAKESTGYYTNTVGHYVQQWRNKLQELKALNASGKASMPSQRKNAVTQALPSLGLGGQQAPSAGFPSAGTAKAATGTSHSSASSASAAQTAGASGHDATSAPPAFPHGIRPGQLCSPRGESTAEELEQFKAKKFTPGKVPQKPPLADLLHGLPCNLM